MEIICDSATDEKARLDLDLKSFICYAYLAHTKYLKTIDDRILVNRNQTIKHLATSDNEELVYCLNQCIDTHADLMSERSYQDGLIKGFLDLIERYNLEIDKTIDFDAIIKLL